MESSTSVNDLDQISITKGTFGKSFLKKSATLQGISSFIKSHTSTDLTNIGKEDGALLAEIQITFSAKTNIVKQSQQYSFNVNGKKEIGKCLVQVGFIFDTPYVFKKLIPEVTIEQYLNFYVHTNSTPVWKKYWCLFQNREILVQDFNKDVIKIFILE